MNDRHRSTRSSEESTINSDQVTILDLLLIFAKRKWLILGMTIGLAMLVLVALLISMALPATSRWNLLPPKYTATAKVLIQEGSSGSGIPALLGQSGLGSLSSLLTGGSAFRATNADFAQALLRGRYISDMVTDKYDFVGRYRIAANPKTATREKYNQGLKVRYDVKTGILEIGYEDIDKNLATDVVNEATERLQEQFNMLTANRAQTRRLYLEQAIMNQQKEADQAAERLGAFQNKHGVYDLTAQSQANISALSSLQASLVSKQMDLDIQRKYFPESDQRILVLKEQISQLQDQIDGLKTGKNGSQSGPVALSKMVDLASEYTSLKADVEIQDAILIGLKQQYESAKLEEQGNSGSLQIIEKAEVPEIRSSPRRAMIAVFGTIAGFFVGVILAFAVEYVVRARQDPVESEKLAEFRANMRLRRK